MANQANKPTEHPFRTISKIIASAAETGAYPRVMLLFGTERYLVRWACGFIREAVVEPACEALDFISLSAADASVYEVIAACETLPFMSKKKLVMVDADQYFQSSQDGDGNEASKILAEYLPKLPDTTMLVLVCSKVNKSRSLYRAAEKTGLAFDFTFLDDATLRGWVKKRIAQTGKTADAAMVVNFARASGYADGESYTLYSLENDILKAAALAQGSEITRQDFFAIYNAPAQTNVFSMLDSAFSGNKEEAYRVLRDSIDLQQASKQDGVVIGFVGLLCSQLEIMLEGKERMSQGQTDLNNMAKEMGVNFYRLKKAMQTSSNRSIQQLKNDLYNAYQIEKDMKNGIMEARLAFELFISAL